MPLLIRTVLLVALLAHSAWVGAVPAFGGCCPGDAAAGSVDHAADHAAGRCDDPVADLGCGPKAERVLGLGERASSRCPSASSLSPRVAGCGAGGATAASDCCAHGAAGAATSDLTDLASPASVADPAPGSTDPGDPAARSTPLRGECPAGCDDCVHCGCCALQGTACDADVAEFSVHLPVQATVAGGTPSLLLSEIREILHVPRLA